MLDIKITKTTHPKEKPQDESKLGFGKQFSDHMFLMDYTAGEGWHDARIVPYGPWEMDPATTVFHYAQEIFEGMKAYRTADGKIQLFRPDCNANRFNDSADRLGMPPIPPEDFVQAVKALVDVDRDWVPHSDGASLYIRPFCIATDVGLGVHAAKHYRFAIICAPSGAYYAEGLDPVRIYVEDEYIRAAPGLTGFTTVSYTHLDVYKRQAQGRAGPHQHVRLWAVCLPVCLLPADERNLGVQRRECLRLRRLCAGRRCAESAVGRAPARRAVARQGAAHGRGGALPDGGLHVL